MADDPVTPITISDIIVKDLKYHTEEFEEEGDDDTGEVSALSLSQDGADDDTGEVVVLSPTDNTKQTIPPYATKWARGSETAGSVDESNTYVEDTATFTKATADEVSITTTAYNLEIVGKSGKKYTDEDYKTLSISSNTVTIRFEYVTASGRPAFIDDLLSGTIYAVAKTT